MHWWQYLIPENPVALAIWYLLLTVFVLWLSLLVAECLELRRKRKQLSNCERIESLEEKLKQQIAWRSGNTREGQAEQDSSEDRNGALTDFYLNAGIGSEAVLAEHVRAIFDAGFNNSQLQVESLIKNTANRLFRRNGILRSVLSLFIIIGLLGTLFGLAYSLAQLLPLAPSSSQVSNTAVAQGLIDLLTQLRGAFAPSIWGVAFTILGVLLFSFYVHRCQSLRDELERLSLTVWVPRLYPSPFQQQLITLVQTEELIRQNRENIKTVADFAENIKTDVEDFGSEIKKAKTTIKNLNKSSAQISEFADKFYAGVEKLAPFQEELARLYNKFMEDSKVFQNGVSKSLSDTTETQKQARDTLMQQSQQLKEVIERLLSYEGAYVKSREELDATLKTVMEDARKAYQDIGERNQEIAAAINESLSVPLREDLTAKLDTVSEILAGKLASIVDRFGTFETPIKTAAEKFAQIVETIDTRAGALMARLQNEYNQQNEANREQLQDLETLNRQLVSFLETLTNVTSKQETSNANLGASLPSLEGKLTTLNEKLGSLILRGFSPNEPRGSTDTTRIERQIKENATKLHAELDKLARIGDEIRTLLLYRNGRKEMPGTTAVEARDYPFEKAENTSSGREVELGGPKDLVRGGGADGGSATIQPEYGKLIENMSHEQSLSQRSTQTPEKTSIGEDLLSQASPIPGKTKEPRRSRVTKFIALDEYSKGGKGYISWIKNRLSKTTASLKKRFLRR